MAERTARHEKWQHRRAERAEDLWHRERQRNEEHGAERAVELHLATVPHCEESAARVSVSLFARGVREVLRLAEGLSWLLAEYRWRLTGEEHKIGKAHAWVQRLEAIRAGLQPLA